MDATPITHTKPSSLESFSYEKTKSAFEEKQYYYLKGNRLSIVRGTLQLWSREKINSYIAAIQEIENDGFDEDSTPEELKPYEILPADEFGTYKLVLKHKQYRGQNIEIIPWETCFDVILQAHRRIGHRRSLKIMYRHICKRYVIDKIWIKLLLKSCNMCEFDQIQSIEPVTDVPKTYYKCYEIFDIAMPTPDPPFNSILVIIHKITKFVHLRPITASQPITVATEVMKVFSDFGVPNVLLAKNGSLFEEVCALVNELTLARNSKIPVMIAQSNQYNLACDEIRTHLNEWMSVTDSSNWAFGCQIVQWQLNNTRCGDTTPYQQIFHRNPIIDIFD